MRLRRLHLLLPLGVFLLAIGAGWYATTSLQRSVTIGTGLQACWKLEGDARQIECLSDEFARGAREAAAGEHGADRDTAILAYVRATEVGAADDERLAGLCHPAMHELGRSEGGLAARSNRVPTFPGGSSQLCTAGYVHGLAEGYLVGTPDAEVAAVFPALCHDTRAREGCAHGVGHALLRARADDPAVASSVAAAKRCRDLPHEFPTNCINGVYMELSMRMRPEPVAPADYATACAQASDVEESLSCWGYMTLNLRSNDVPLSEAPEWCGRADLPGQFSCIDQYGRDLGVEDVAACTASGHLKELRERCVDGAVGLQVGSGHVSTSEAKRACGTIDDSKLVRYCKRAVGRYAEGRKLVEQDEA